VEQGEQSLAEILEEVRRIELQSRRLVTDVMAGGYVSVFRGAGVEFDSVREYVEGDSPRMIDWNVTARMGRPFVKTYVDERELSVLFALDLSASMGGGFGVWSARQTAARVCACLALSATRNDDKVGLITVSDRVESNVTPGKGIGHSLRIVRDCLALPARSARTDLRPALEFASRAVRQRSILFLVSDFLTDGWQDALNLCARRHDVIAVRLLTPELEALPRALVRVRDPETGAATTIDGQSRRVREAYASRVDAWRQKTEEDLRRANVDLMDVPVPRVRGKDLIAGPILKFFRMRELRGAKR
jgi:uncharacterized protein (DUF58 family)